MTHSKRYRVLGAGVVALLGAHAAASQPPQVPTLAGDPYVYTHWESFTSESTNGALINDHIFFLRPDGDSLWIGTEGGLVLYYHGTWKSWTAAGTALSSPSYLTRSTRQR